MRADDRARYLRSTAKPAIWSAAPSLGAADKITYGAKKAGQDQAMQQEQDKLLQHMRLPHAVGRYQCACGTTATNQLV